jgi:hypothetical protein
VPGIAWTYLRFVQDAATKRWRPAAGTFDGWPRSAHLIRLLDPCMGSGHFLAFALPVLVRCAWRRRLSIARAAVDAVVRDNLHGLELDERCTQIAAFNVGLTAWKLAGYRPLPALNLACAGLGINAPVAAWTALAGGDTPAENAMKQLYELFRQAPTLGSLIDPTRIGGELFVANFERIRGLLSTALASERSEESELAVVAQGVAKAALILAHRYTLVATNVPYLGRGKQGEILRDHCERFHPDAKSDLATSFVERCLRFAAAAGSVALVTPQHWWFLGSYRNLRKALLLTSRVDALAALGEEAWQSFGDRGPVAALFIATNARPKDDSSMRGIDALPEKSIAAKTAALLSGPINVIRQRAQYDSPDHRITIDEPVSGTLLSAYAESFQGVSPLMHQSSAVSIGRSRRVTHGGGGRVLPTRRNHSVAGRWFFGGPQISRPLSSLVTHISEASPRGGVGALQFAKCASSAVLSILARCLIRTRR